MLSSDVVWFSAGATASAKLLSLRTPAYLREQGLYESKLRRSYKSLERHEAQIQDVQAKLTRLRREMTNTVSDKLQSQLDNQLWLEQRLIQLQTGLKPYHPNLIRRVFGGGFELIKRVGSYFLWINDKPRRIRGAHKTIATRFERWYASRRALPGYSQIEYRIAQIETQVAESRAKFLSRMSRPADASFETRSGRTLNPRQLYELRSSLDENLTQAAKAWEKWESLSNEIVETGFPSKASKSITTSAEHYEHGLRDLQSWLDHIREQSQALKQVSLRATDQLPRPLPQVNLEAEISKFLDKEWNDFFESSTRLIRLGRIMERGLADMDSIQLNLSQLETLKLNFERLNQFKSRLPDLYLESLKARPWAATPPAPETLIDELIKRPSLRTKSLVKNPEWQDWLKSKEWQTRPNKVPDSLKDLELQNRHLQDGFEAFQYQSARESSELVIGKWIGDQFRIFLRAQFD